MSELSTREILEETYANLLPEQIGDLEVQRWIKDQWAVPTGTDRDTGTVLPQSVVLACSIGAMMLASTFDLRSMYGIDESTVAEKMQGDPALREAVLLLHEVVKEVWPNRHREVLLKEIFDDYHHPATQTDEWFAVRMIVLFNDASRTDFNDICQLFERAIKKAVAREEAVV